MWTPDRDNMTGVWEGLLQALFYSNLHSVIHRRYMPENYISGIAHDKGDQAQLWYDLDSPLFYITIPEVVYNV